MPLKDSREIGADPIDSQLARRAASRPVGRLDILFRSRPALGLAPAAAPALLFLPLGLLLGPRVLGVLSEPVLAHLDAVVSVALAALGVFVGLALRLRGPSDGRLFAAATAEASVTMLVVFAASLYLLLAWGVPTERGALIVALTLGICAAASSAGAAELSSDPVHQVATRVADLDDVLPIAVGAFVLAWLRAPSLFPALQLTLFTGLVGVAIAGACWLLVERAHSEAERGVFVAGGILLLGGAASYLALSPLLAGVVAGLFWTYTPGRADQILRADLQKLQHPLVALLLLTAGATIAPSLEAIWLLVPFVAFRLTGKLAGGWLASRLAARVAPADLGAYLIPPGVIGVAFALNFHQVVASTSGAAVVSAVAIGSVIGEGLALIALPLGESR